jgi:hypothetical protein
MKPDIYTKAVLTVIAVALAVIACNQAVRPSATVQAQVPPAPFAGVLYSTDGSRPTFFDQRTGEIWEYHDYSVGAKVATKYRISKLGQPLTVEVSRQ